MIGWWRDVINEAQHKGDHTRVVQIQPPLRHDPVHRLRGDVLRRLVLGLLQRRAVPATPPRNSCAPSSSAASGRRRASRRSIPWHLPLLNTLILLTSGTTVTWAHHALLHGDREGLKKGLWCTVILGALFTCVQAYEYSHAHFAFSGNVYGATFFMATGFHGFHVLVGTIFLIVCLGARLCGPLHAEAASRLRVRGLVLALRRRGVDLPVRRDLRVGLRRRRSRALRPARINAADGESSDSGAASGPPFCSWISRSRIGPRFWRAGLHAGYALAIAVSNRLQSDDGLPDPLRPPRPRCAASPGAARAAAKARCSPASSRCGRPARPAGSTIGFADAGDGPGGVRHPVRRVRRGRRGADHRVQICAAVLGACAAVGAARGHRLRRPAAAAQGLADRAAVSLPGARRPPAPTRTRA